MSLIDLEAGTRTAVRQAPGRSILCTSTEDLPLNCHRNPFRTMDQLTVFLLEIGMRDSVIAIVYQNDERSMNFRNNAALIIVSNAVYVGKGSWRCERIFQSSKFCFYTSR